MDKRILILGKGFIGQRLQKGLNCPLSGKKIVCLKDVYTVIDRYKPKVLINCIGFTGEKNVDGCELDPYKALFSNSYVPMLLAEGILRRNIKLVHISTGCIYHYDYSKSSAITEEKIPDYFALFYSRTKIYSEGVLENLSRRYNMLILRIRLPLDDYPHPKNILSKLIRYKTINNTPNSLTYIPDFIEALKHLIKIDARGLFNVVNKGALRYPDILEIYKKYVPDFEFEIIDYNKLRIKRTNLILSCRKLEKTGFKMHHIKEILEDCVKNYVKNSQ